MDFDTDNPTIFTYHPETIRQYVEDTIYIEDEPVSEDMLPLGWAIHVHSDDQTHVDLQGDFEEVRQTYRQIEAVIDALVDRGDLVRYDDGTVDVNCDYDGGPVIAALDDPWEFSEELDPVYGDDETTTVAPDEAEVLPHTKESLPPETTVKTASGERPLKNEDAEEHPWEEQLYPEQ